MEKATRDLIKKEIGYDKQVKLLGKSKADTALCYAILGFKLAQKNLNK